MKVWLSYRKKMHYLLDKVEVVGLIPDKLIDPL